MTVWEKNGIYNLFFSLKKIIFFFLPGPLIIIEIYILFSYFLASLRLLIFLHQTKHAYEMPTYKEFLSQYL